MRTVTMGDLGRELPVGIPGPGGKREKALSFKRWTALDDRIIGEWVDGNKSRPHGELVQFILNRFLVAFGPHSDFQALPEGKRGLALAQATAGDVLYTWLALRSSALGDEIGLDIGCPTCRGRFSFAGSLADLDVVVPEDGEVLRWEVELKDGLEYLGATRHRVTLRPFLWGIYRDAAGLRGEGAMKLRVLHGSIVGVDGFDGDVVVPESALEALSKRDFNALSTAVAERTVGPVMALAGVCPHCRGKWARSLPWVYDPFFSELRSSLSPTVDASGASYSSCATGSTASHTT